MKYLKKFNEGVEENYSKQKLFQFLRKLGYQKTKKDHNTIFRKGEFSDDKVLALPNTDLEEKHYRRVKNELLDKKYCTEKEWEEAFN